MINTAKFLVKLFDIILYSFSNNWAILVYEPFLIFEFLRAVVCHPHIKFRIAHLFTYLYTFVKIQTGVVSISLLVKRLTVKTKASLRPFQTSMMEVNSYFSQIVVALEGHVIGCFWNNSRRFLLVWGMSSFSEQLL